MIEQLQMLRDSLLKVNKSVRALQKCELYSPLMRTLLSVPGVGPLAALTLVTEIADMSRFGSFRQLNSCGVIPY
jgi:transposase